MTKTRTKHLFKEPPDLAKKHISIQSFYKQARPGLVKVVCDTDKDASQTGSGFFVSKAGLVVTSWSVIRHPDFSGVRIEINGNLQLKAKVLAIDPDADLAVLKPISPTAVNHVFSGRPAGDVKFGEAAVTIGHPSDLRLLFGTGLISGIRTVAQVREALEERVPLRHKYKYLQTNVFVCRSSRGGPLLDEKGRVLGVVTSGIRASRTGFAVEWQAVADLLKKAKGAVPVSPASIRRRSAAEERRPTIFFGPSTDAGDITFAADLARRSLHCGKCRGSGVIVEVVKTRKKERRRIFVTGPGIKPHYRYKWVTVTETEKVPSPCKLCQGHGINPQSAKSYKRLCDLVRVMSRLDETDEQLSSVWQKATQTLEESAFDDVLCASKLTEHARATLGTPQKHLGDPVVFIGKLQAVKLARGASHLLVVIYGVNQPAYVWCPSSVTAMQGQWCQVSGVVAGVIENTPLVTAVNVSGLHVNTKLEPLEKSSPHRRR